MKKKLIILMLLPFIVSFISCNETTEVVYEYGEEEMIKYIWDSNIVYNESVVLIEKDGQISGNLLFNPIEIISVRDYTLEKEYLSEEFEINGNIIKATSESTMPFFTENQSIGVELKEGYALSASEAKIPGETILFTEGVGIVMHIVNVTYTYNGEWDGPVQNYQGQYLTNVLDKLENSQPVNMVVFGDSIATGCNASSKLGIAPFQKDFSSLVVDRLNEEYNADIQLINTSLGGSLSSWGAGTVETNVNQYNPDLVIIGFGMNDGSWKIPATEYKNNIETIIQSIQAHDDTTDILVIATILANPDSIQNQIQYQYLQVLNELQTEYNVGVVDMTSFSTYLLQTKNSLDLYANNINHPNDFLTRMYAMNLLKSIIEE